MANPACGTERQLSRIESDVESVRMMTNNIEGTTERIIRHANSLGYFAPSEPQSIGQGCSPVPAPPATPNLADALRDLRRAVDRCSGSLNVFD